MTPRQAALIAHGAGLCVVPPATDGSKAPRPGGKQQWKKCQQQRPTEQELTTWYADESVVGVGLVTGAISGGLELFEFEGRAVTEGVYTAFWRAAQRAGLGELVHRVAAGYSERSPTGGVHWLYRCAGEIQGRKLAQRPATGEELQGAPDHKVQVLIETKGEGGYVIVAPSNGSTHPTGKPWKLRRGGLNSIATISAEEREALHQLARSLDRMPTRPTSASNTAGGNRPGDQYNEQTSWHDLLISHDWQELWTRDGVTYWRRPGKTTPGVSATTNALGTDHLKVFSTSTPFSIEGTYDRFGAYAVLEHGGDHRAAARHLAGPRSSVDERLSQATVLVQIARDRYDLGQSLEGDTFAVAKKGPAVARLLRGDSSLRAELAAVYFDTHDKAATGSALADALAVLDGTARRQSRTAVALRLTRHSTGEIVLDLGGASCRAVVIRPGSWEAVDRSPVLFRRTALTGEMPEPERGGDLDQLRVLLNISDESWPLLVAWLVSAWIPEIAHAVLWLIGEQGTGKSEAMRMLASLLDPSPAMKRSTPRDLEQWMVVASGSYLVPLDNVSTISDWQSDAICRSSTGDGMVRRQLYTNNELTVNSFRRVVMLNGIDAGALRGDLGQRLVPIELEQIPDERRQSEKVLHGTFARLRPKLFGALLDLLAQVLAWQIEHPEPAHGGARMADFAEVIAAVDAIRSTDAAQAYRDAQDSISTQVIESDPVAEALVSWLRRRPEKTWRGAAEELLRELPRPDYVPRTWPVTGQSLSGRLRRAAPALREVGIGVEFGKSNRRRWISLRVVEQPQDGQQTELWRQ